MFSRANKFWVVIPAAGVGRRFGGDIPKQYRKVHNKTVLEHSIKLFLASPRFEKVIIALHESDDWFADLPVAQHSKLRTVTGGGSRAISVLNALKALPSDASSEDWVLVHDAVRPCLLATDINKLIKEVGDDAVGGILSAPVSDSLKQVEQMRVTQSVDRNYVWRALTPQMFKLSLLMEGLSHSFDKNKQITDEASAIEAIGGRPKIIAGHPNNIKITWEADLTIAEALLTFQTGRITA